MEPHPHGENRRKAAATLDTKKRLFVLCDGTWQDGINNKSPLTNVATLARCLEPIDSDGCPQTVYYDSGIGNVTSAPSQIVDAITGRGISAKIRNAYSFLAHNYNFRRESDEIILVGFSRGAFAVQCLASLISQTGLLEKQYLYYLRGLFTLWAHQKIKGGSNKLAEEVQRLKDAEVLRSVTITACAVWDTVSSLGLPTELPPRALSFVGKQVPNRVDHAFQALALDEKRSKFKPCLWECIEPGEHRVISVSQCWFLGAHADVGGNGDAALGAMTLLWMIGKLHDRVGVLFNESEIAKHLKHKYLEWEFAVNKTFGVFKETRVLSTIPHSGQAGEPGWWWIFLGRQTRANSLTSTALRESSQLQSVPAEVHFSVRLAMASKRNKCRILETWKTVHVSNKVQWQSKDGLRKLDEHTLGQPSSEDREHYLLLKWCNREFPPRTDRLEFVELQGVIEDPGSGKGLRTFADFLLECMVFVGDDLAPSKVYPLSTRCR